jgi:uncharacterized protein (DUF983 family)
MEPRLRAHIHEHSRLALHCSLAIMMTSASGGVIHCIVHQICPRCRIGRIFRSSIFRGFPAMRETCLVCGLKFEREEGYFVGAMMIDYGLGLAITAAIGVVVWCLTRWPVDKVASVAFFIFLPIIPTLTRFGRVLWIYLDQAIEPADDQPDDQ